MTTGVYRCFLRLYFDKQPGLPNALFPAEILNICGSGLILFYFFCGVRVKWKECFVQPANNRLNELYFM